MQYGYFVVYGDLSNQIKEHDVLFDDTMSSWTASNVYVWLPGTWDQSWTKDVVIGNYEISATAEVFFWSNYVHGNPPPQYNLESQTSTINVSLRDYSDDAPSNISASQGTYTDKVRVTWSPASGNSELTAAAMGWKGVQYTLTVNSSGASSVSISSSTGHSGTTNYTKTVTSGTSVNLQAPYYVGTGSSRTRFNGWTGSVPSPNQSITFNMDDNKTVTANYISDPEYCLYLTKTGNGRVKVNGTLRTLPYSECFSAGTNVTLEAVPDTYWQFSYWSGDLSGSTNPASIVMNGNKSVTANFSQPVYPLNLLKTGSGSVKVEGALQTLPWSGNFTAGTNVPLEAVPAANWQFSDWSGDLTGNTNPNFMRV